MENVLKLLKSAGIYFLGNVMTRLISFFLLPVYTSYIAKADMGYFDVSTTYLNVLVPVICLEVWSGIMRFMFDFKEHEDKYKVIFNGMVIFSGSVLLYTVLFVVLGIVADIQSLVLIFFYGVLLMLQNLYTYLARGLGFNRAFAVSGIISSLVNSVSNILMIYLLGMRLNSLYIAMILGLLSQMILLEGRVRVFSNISFKMLDASMIRSMIRFSLPLCLNSACFWFLSSYNRVGISHTLGLEANGIYTVAGKFTMVLSVVANCFSLAWQELVYSLGNRKENKGHLYSIASNYYLTLLMLGTMMILPAVKIIFPYFIDAAYQDAFPIIPLYIFATALSTYSGFLGNIFGAEKKTNVIFYSTLIAAVINVGVFHLSVWQIGLHAANIGLTLGYFANIIMRILILRKFFEIHLDYFKIFFTMILNVPVFYVYLTQGVLLNVAVFAAVGGITLLMYYKVIRSFLSSAFKRKPKTTTKA